MLADGASNAEEWVQFALEANLELYVTFKGSCTAESDAK